MQCTVELTPVSTAASADSFGEVSQRNAVSSSLERERLSRPCTLEGGAGNTRILARNTRSMGGGHTLPTGQLPGDTAAFSMAPDGISAALSQVR